MKPGKVVLVLACRCSGRKVVVVMNIDDGTSDWPYSHALVAGIDRYPCKVTASMGKKKITRRSKIKSFVKVYNYNHLMPTRYSANIPLDKTVNKDVFRDTLSNTGPHERQRSSLMRDTTLARTNGSSRSCGFRSVPVIKNIKKQNKTKLDSMMIFYFYLVCFTFSISYSVLPFHLVYFPISPSVFFFYVLSQAKYSRKAFAYTYISIQSMYNTYILEDLWTFA